MIDAAINCLINVWNVIIGEAYLEIEIMRSMKERYFPENFLLFFDEVILMFLFIFSANMMIVMKSEKTSESQEIVEANHVVVKEKEIEIATGALRDGETDMISKYYFSI